MQVHRPHVQGSTRVMPACLAMGEAAGIAVSMAATAPARDVHAVATDRLRAALKDNGAYLPQVGLTMEGQDDWFKRPPEFEPCGCV